jgi:hypothetical protein
MTAQQTATVEKARDYLKQAALDRAFDAGFAIRFDGTGTDFNPSRHVMQTVSQPRPYLPKHDTDGDIPSTTTGRPTTVS